MICFLFFILCISNVYANKPTLLILQFEKQRELFQSFITLLQSQGKTIEVVIMDDEITFESYGEYNYESVYVLAPKYSFKQISKNDFKKFISNGGNVFFTVSQVSTSNVKSFLQLFKVTLGNNEKHIEKNVKIEKNNLFPETEVFFRGVPMEIPTSNAMIPLIKDGNGKTSGILAFAFQGMTNGRLSVISSVDMFNDVNFEMNKKFIVPLIQWVMHKHGELELKNVQFTKLDGKPDIENEGMYFTNDTISVTFEIEETMNGKTSKYLADDVQVEYRYVTPVILDYATHDSTGLYNFTTVLPDQFGVYTVRINYTRPLLTNLYFDQVTPIRPWRHDHIERFQKQCYPFYLAFIMMSLSTVLFVAIYLNYENDKPNQSVTHDIKTD